MKSVLIVVALLVSTAYVQCSPNSDLLDQLDDLMFQAFRKGNKNAVNVISEAIDTVGLALLQMPAADEAQKAELQGHLDVVRADMPKLEALVNGSIKTRGFFQDIGKAFNFVKSKATMLVQNVSKAVDSFVHNGLPQIVAVVKPFVENVVKNVKLSQVVDGLGTVTGALSQINKMTNGAIAPLSGLTDILSNIESTGKFVQEMTAANNTDAIADALINTLTTAKSSHLNKIEKALDYVCVGLDQIEAEEAAKAANAA